MPPNAGPPVHLPKVSDRDGLRVLHLVSSLETGGMEHFVARIAQWQREQGLDARVLACRGGALQPVLDASGVPLTVLGSGRWRRMSDLVAAAGRFRPDVFHAHNQPALPYALLGRLLSVPRSARTVLTFHGQGAHGVRSLRSWERVLTDHVVAVSDGARDRLAAGKLLADAEFAARVSVISNGVRPAPLAGPASEVRSARRREWGLEDRVVGVIVARVDGRKGHDTLLHACARLRDLPFTLLVVGDGIARPELETLAQQLELGTDRVRFLGARNDVPDILAAADLFVLPSLSEGMPLSVLEAMAAGLAVVATRVGGLPELIPDAKHGSLVSVGDSNALADAMRELIRDEAKRASVGAAARARVEQHFSFDAMGNAYTRLYRRLLAGHEAGLPAYSH